MGVLNEKRCKSSVFLHLSNSSGLITRCLNTSLIWLHFRSIYKCLENDLTNHLNPLHTKKGKGLAGPGECPRGAGGGARKVEASFSRAKYE